MNDTYNWKWFKAGRMTQVRLENGEDIANLANLDKKYWLAISMPVKGSRFDARMLQFLDSDSDGRIRTEEVLGAIEFLKSKGVKLDELFHPSDADRKALADVLEKQADLAKVEPSKADKAAMADWEAKSKSPEVAICGEATAEADAALAAVDRDSIKTHILADYPGETSESVDAAICDIEELARAGKLFAPDIYEPLSLAAHDRPFVQARIPGKGGLYKDKAARL